ncbi:Smr/MutS family protein [candidate division KSB1 bacterium]|nr:Smr/MutS family protein [candidate division KSB1 bacterium]
MKKIKKWWEELEEIAGDEGAEPLPEFIEVTNELDLHGFFPEQIPEIINEFITNAIRLKIKYLRIVHGKGKSKLKWAVREVLKSDERVIDFKDAPPELGGWGATIIAIQKEE